MELIYKGKTKDVYQLENGLVRLQFKDDMTGKDGVFDPGENQVGLTVEGSGRAGLALTEYFYNKINATGIKTHFVSADLDNQTMDVRSAEVYGQGLEVICRYRAVGSFYRRYGKYIEEGAKLDGYFEVTIKDDERQDPLINEDALVALNIFKEGEYAEMKAKTRQICDLVKEELAAVGLDLYDIKLEFGRDSETGDVMLIDEISGGNMRVYKGNDYVMPLEIGDYLLGQ